MSSCRSPSGRTTARKRCCIARAADNKDRWILALDEATGKTRVLAHDHDDAWMDGPGVQTRSAG